MPTDYDDLALPLANVPAVKRLTAREKETRRAYNLATPQQKAGMTPADQLEEAMERGDFEESDLWASCQPIEPSLLESIPDEQSHYEVIEVIANGGVVAEYSPLSLGVQLWHPEFPELPLVHAVKTLHKLYPYHQGDVELRFAWRENDIAKRREKARRLLPNVLEQFPKGMRKFDELKITKWNRSAIEAAQKWVADARTNIALGRGMCIRHEQTGSGKTALLGVAAIEAVKQFGLHAHFVYVPDLVAGSWRDIEAALKLAEQTDILVLDDIDASVRPSRPPHDVDSSRSRSALLRLVNRRYNDRLPVFWSSNTASGEEILYNLGERISRRIIERNVKLEFGDGAWDWGSR